MDYFRVSATFEKASTLKDGSLRVTFDTQDLDAEKMAKVFQMRKEIGHLIFARPNTTIEVPEEKPKGIPDPPNMKKRSVKMRNVLYRIWEKQKAAWKTTLNAENYYMARMDEMIDGLMEELE